jgi:hypothetical protein
MAEARKINRRFIMEIGQSTYHKICFCPFLEHIQNDHEAGQVSSPHPARPLALCLAFADDTPKAASRSTW